MRRMRWSLLKKYSRVRERARQRLDALLASKQPTARAVVLKEAFQHFWTYRSRSHALRFLEAWCQRAVRSRLGPMKRMARTLRRHQPLILNWFLAKGELSSGPVAGLNNKVRVTTRRASVFAPSEPWKSHSTKTLENYPFRHEPTDSADEAEKEVSNRKEPSPSRRGLLSRQRNTDPTRPSLWQ